MGSKMMMHFGNIRIQVYIEEHMMMPKNMQPFKMFSVRISKARCVLLTPKYRPTTHMLHLKMDSCERRIPIRNPHFQGPS